MPVDPRLRWFAPCGRVEAMVPVTQRSLCIPGSRSMLLGVALQTQISFRPAPTDISCLDLLAGLGLVLNSLPSWACSHGDSWLRPVSAEFVVRLVLADVPTWHLLLQNSLAWAQTQRGLFPRPVLW